MTISKITAPAAAALLALATPATTINLNAADTPPPATTQSQSQLANELIGAWILVGTPSHVGEAPSAGGRYKIFTGSHWCMTQADANTGVVIYHHGGTYQLNGNEYDETVEYANPSTMDGIGRTGRYSIQIKGDLMTDIGINNHWREVWKRVKPDAGTADSPLGSELTGTWKLVSAPNETGDTPPPGEDLKLYAGGHWCNTYADPKNHVVIIHHGGTYTVKGNRYSENVYYSNPDRMELIGHTFDFDMKLKGDTLTITGIGNPWNEVWKRVD